VKEMKYPAPAPRLDMNIDAVSDRLKDWEERRKCISFRQVIEDRIAMRRHENRGKTQIRRSA